MSRSKHTRPRHILAAARLRAPYSARGHDDPSRQRHIARILKESGIVGFANGAHPDGTAPLPRITLQRPQAGYHHPLTKRDIESVLHFFGEECFYGLRLIELVQAPRATSNGRLALGRLTVPGRITLFAQPGSPWIIAGKLRAQQHDLLGRGGAQIETTDMEMRTRVIWPNGTLRDFMLFDVLMHEVGHHILQQYKGKRTMRVVRTKDHEAFADRFAVQCRLIYQHALQSV